MCLSNVYLPASLYFTDWSYYLVAFLLTLLVRHGCEKEAPIAWGEGSTVDSLVSARAVFSLKKLGKIRERMQEGSKKGSGRKKEAVEKRKRSKRERNVLSLFSQVWETQLVEVNKRRIQERQVTKGQQQAWMGKTSCYCEHALQCTNEREWPWPMEKSDTQTDEEEIIHAMSW